MKTPKKEKTLTKYELRALFQGWLDQDLVRAGTVYNIAEKRNEAFARGWRWAIHSVIRQIEENE